jgi:apolipoprotein D and lipocalin family protein
MIWAAALALAACAAPEPGPAPGLRTAGAWISSASLFDPARFAGQWKVAESGTPGCAGATQDWRYDGRGAYALSGVDCSGAKPRHLSGRAVVTGPGGRITPDAGFGREPVWVLWVDQDYRVAVLGTPSGRFGMVLARDLPVRSDLAAAAREVLSFNGYIPGKVGR